MKESDVEKHLAKTVHEMGGKTWKFKSMNCRGVADRIVCLPNGDTWFIELKTKGGKLSPLQKIFADEMQTLNQKYDCLWSKDHINQWRKENER